MDSISLDVLADELFAAAAQEASSGRAARTIHGGSEHPLRQTLIAILGERDMSEHESPGEATLQVLRGRVRLVAGDETWEGGRGDYVRIPPARHSLVALEDSAVLLTVLADQ